MSEYVEDPVSVASEPESVASGAEEEPTVEETPVEEESYPVEEEAPVEESAPAEEAPVEEAPVEEVPVEEESAPVEDAPVEDAPVEESAPVEEAPPVSTQEVVQNVQEILSSTETNVSGNDLENRVKVLEERLEKLIGLIIKYPNGSAGLHWNE